MQNILRIDLGGVNGYLLKNEGRFILVDTGGHMFLDKPFTDRRDMLVSQLEKNGVTDANLELIILTHGDNDHACNAAYIRDKYHSRIAMHAEDAFMVRKSDSECYKINANYRSLPLKLIFKMMDQKIKLLMEKVYAEFEVFEPDILLEHGQSLSEYGFEGTVLHAPGHTSGSICILDSEGNLIAGDLFTRSKKKLSLAINAQNFGTMKESAEIILQNRIVHIYPGHGEPFDFL